MHKMVSDKEDVGTEVGGDGRELITDEDDRATVGGNVDEGDKAFWRGNFWGSNNGIRRQHWRLCNDNEHNHFHEHQNQWSSPWEKEEKHDGEDEKKGPPKKENKGVNGKEKKKEKKK